MQLFIRMLLLIVAQRQQAGTPVYVAVGEQRPTLVGLYQINALVPAGVVPGNSVAVIVTVGGISSNMATIAVQ